MQKHEFDQAIGRNAVRYRPQLALACGDAKAALLLSQAVYWHFIQAKSGKTSFWKTEAEWTREIGLTRREQETARKKLRELGFITEAKHGPPYHVHYAVNIREIVRATQIALNALGDG